MSDLDLIITNVSVVVPGQDDAQALDIGVKDGTIVRLEAGLPTDLVGPDGTVVDGGGKVAFPGVVDAHQHWGIYNPLPEDAVSESRASAQGGVTTAITYMRTGQYYLNKGGDYADFFPEVLALTDGKATIDYAFHLA
ncbi:MAG: hydantoinase, partial [Actinomycetales bacterium]